MPNYITEIAIMAANLTSNLIHEYTTSNCLIKVPHVILK